MLVDPKKHPVALEMAEDLAAFTNDSPATIEQVFSVLLKYGALTRAACAEAAGNVDMGYGCQSAAMKRELP